MAYTGKTIWVPGVTDVDAGKMNNLEDGVEKSYGKRILWEGISRGLEGTYLATVGNARQSIYRDSAKLNPLRLSWTPEVDCWIEVVLNLGLLQKLDAAYNYTYVGITCTPTDEDAVTLTQAILTGHLTVMQYLSAAPGTQFKCLAGYNYVFQAFFGASNGGSWSYYIDRDWLSMRAKAWAR